MIGDSLLLRVDAATAIAPTLRHLRLVAADGGKLPPASAGAHVQLSLKAAARTHRNAYSLVSRPGARDAYEIIVRRVEASRGGSAFIHEQLAVGDTVEAAWPGNLFPPVRTARHQLMIAGGIGITPFLSYLAEFGLSGASHALHVCCRPDEREVFAPWLPEGAEEEAATGGGTGGETGGETGAAVGTSGAGAVVPVVGVVEPVVPVGVVEPVAPVVTPAVAAVPAVVAAAPVVAAVREVDAVDEVEDEDEDEVAEEPAPFVRRAWPLGVALVVGVGAALGLRRRGTRA